ncbi:PIN domain-containing protein [Salana multivorans]
MPEARGGHPDLGPGEVTLLARTRARYGLKMPDTCVLATAVVAETPLLTFDDRLAAVADRLGLLHQG